MKEGGWKLLAVACLVAVPGVAQGGQGIQGEGAARRIAASQPAPLGLVLRQVLESNPDVAAATARARAAAARVPQARALPDPRLGVTGFVLPAETRVGSQQATAVISQRLPWIGKRGLRQRVAALEAQAAWARAEALGLEAITEARRLYYEIAFMDALAEVTRNDRATLGHYEELARGRYESGVGLDQGVIKLQAEITRDQTKLLRIEKDRVQAVAALNALRHHPARDRIPEVELPQLGELVLDLEALRGYAMEQHPRVQAAVAELEAARTGVELAQKETKPDFDLALTYARVQRRDDAAGRRSPPPDDGQDVLGVSATFNLPVRRSRLLAEVEEAREHLLAKEQEKWRQVTEIDRSVADLGRRLPLLWRELRLLEDVLAIQAEHSLNSAEAAYSAGALNALDLLDAERVLLDVRIGIQRARADYGIRCAELEAAVAGPLEQASGDRQESGSP